MNKKKVLITGAAGNIGRKLRNALGPNYTLTLLDKKTTVDDEIIHADLREYDPRWIKHFEGIDTVIHLAANPYTDARWEQLVPDNIDAVLNICGACAENGVRQLIFASSCHTMGGYRGSESERVTEDMEPIPDCDYGASKLIGERICKSYSERYLLSVICLRVGWVLRGDESPDEKTVLWRRNLWLSNRDLVQVFEKAIESKDIPFAILFAISNNSAMMWDLKKTMETLNYVPEDGM